MRQVFELGRLIKAVPELFQFAIEPILCQLRLAVLQHCRRLVFVSRFYCELELQGITVLLLDHPATVEDEARGFALGAEDSLHHPFLPVLVLALYPTIWSLY